MGTLCPEEEEDDDPVSVDLSTPCSAAVRPISAAIDCHPVPPAARVGSVVAAPPASRAPTPRGVKLEVVNEGPWRRRGLQL